MFLSLLRYFRDPRLARGTAEFSKPAKPAPETQVIHLGYIPDPERKSFAPERWATNFAARKRSIEFNLGIIDRLKLETMNAAGPRLRAVELSDGRLLPLAIECKEFQSKLGQHAYILFQLLKAWDDEGDTEATMDQAYKTRKWAEQSFEQFCRRHDLMPEEKLKSLLLEVVSSARKEHL